MAIGKAAGRWLAVGVCAGVVVWGLQGQSANAPGSLDRTGNAAHATRDAAPLVRIPGDVSVVGQQQPIHLDAAMARQALRDGELRVALPDGSTYAVRMERQETDRFGQWSVIGRVRSPVADAAMVLTFGGDAVFGTLPLPDGRALQIVTNHGRTLASLAGGLVPPEKGIVTDIAGKPRQDLAAGRARRLAAAASNTRSRAASSAASSRPKPVDTRVAAPRPQSAPTTAAAVPTSPVTITVFAVYADDLVALRGSVAAVQTELSNLVVAANQAHIDSGTMARLSLVGMRKIAIASTMENYDALYAMTAAPVADVDTEVLRDQYAADLVTLVRPYADYENCGIAWVGGAGNYGTMTQNLFGYSVVNAEPCGPHVMAHELGHNMGSAHDRATAFVDGEYAHGAYPFSFGYRRTAAPAFATIMAYAEDEPWIGRFSNPLSSACGAPCGIALKSDNVRSITRMAQAIADYRTVSGKAMIADVEAWEPDPETGKSEFLIPIRLNGFAPANGVRFHLQIVGGTATHGTDYPMYGDTTLNSGYVEPYQSEGLFHFGINPDTAVEGDETIVIKITSPDGYPIADDTAVLTIRDDDPRPRVRGRFLVDQDPDSIFGPDALKTQVHGLNGPRDLGQDVFVEPPFEFDIPVAPGSNLELLHLREAWYGSRPNVYLPQVFNDVLDDQFRVVHAPLAVQVSGVMTAPAGQNWSTNPPILTFQMRETWGGKLVHAQSQSNSQGCCGFHWWVHPGATFQHRIDDGLSLSSPSIRILHGVWQDTPLHTQMSTSGTIIVHGGRRYPEGRAGRINRVPVLVEYIRGSDIGSINVHWRTVDGTAKAGQDYVAASGTVTLTNAKTYALAWIDIVGDDIGERGEYFDVVIDPVPGYNLTSPTTRVTIADDDHATGGRQSPPSQ